MFFGFLIFARILFVACMVFIIGYIYGPFSKRRGLSIAARIASIAIILAFIMMNIFAWRGHLGDGHRGDGHRGYGHRGDGSHAQHHGQWEHCGTGPDEKTGPK